MWDRSMGEKFTVKFKHIDLRVCTKVKLFCLTRTVKS